MNLRQTIKRVLREETKKSLTPIIQSLLNYYVEDYKDILCKVEVTPPNQDDENQNPIATFYLVAHKGGYSETIDRIQKRVIKDAQNFVINFAGEEFQELIKYVNSCE
jgi:hypothetical protein